MKKNVKVLAGMMAASMVATALTGCGSSSDSSADLVVWSHFTEDEVDALQDYVDEFNKENDVNVVLKYDSSEFEQVTQSLQSSNGPDVVLGYPHNNIGKLYKAGLLATCPSDLVDQSLYASSALFDSVTVDGELLGVPLSQETIALYYNKDLVSEVPSTFEELAEQAKEVGFEFDINNFYYSAGFLLTGDAYIFKDNDGTLDTTDIGFNCDDTIAGLNFLKSLVDEGIMLSDITDDIALGDFSDGNIGYYISGPWNESTIADAGINYGVVELPTLNGETINTLETVQCGIVSAKCDDQDLAWQFIKYIADNAGETLFETGSRLPVLNSNIEADWFTSNEVAAGFVAQCANATPTPNIAEMDTVWTPCGDDIKAVMTGEMTAEEAAANMVEKITADIESSNSESDSE